MTDTVLRAIADDGSFRVIAAQTTLTAQEVAGVQRVSGATAALLGELLTGAILMRETMAPQFRVQGILKGAGQSGTMVADSHPDGLTRGLVSAPAGGPRLGEGAMLQMMRTLHNGSIQQGIVEVTGEHLSGALMAYMQGSEQIESVIAVSVLLDGERIAAAGGYLVQLLPDASREALAAMTGRLSSLPPLDALIAGGKGAPRALIDGLLAGAKYTFLEESPLRQGCLCSKERLLAALATIEHAELLSMIAEKKDIESGCDYCGKAYTVAVSELQNLLN